MDRKINGLHKQLSILLANFSRVALLAYRQHRARVIFTFFSLKSPPNMTVTQSQQWKSTRDSAVLLIRPIFRVRSPDTFLTIFAIFSLIATEYDDPIPTVADYSRLGGTADSQGPITRPVSDDFRHFFTQIATEYDADPIPIMATRRYCRFSGSGRQTSS